MIACLAIILSYSYLQPCIVFLTHSVWLFSPVLPSLYLFPFFYGVCPILLSLALVRATSDYMKCALFIELSNPTLIIVIKMMFLAVHDRYSLVSRSKPVQVNLYLKLKGMGLVSHLYQHLSHSSFEFKVACNGINILLSCKCQYIDCFLGFSNVCKKVGYHLICGGLCCNFT